MKKMKFLQYFRSGDLAVQPDAENGARRLSATAADVTVRGRWLWFALTLAATPAGAGDWWPPEYTPEYVEVFGEVEFEGTGFFEAPQFAGQNRHGVSLAGKVTLLAEWADGDVAFRFTPFARVDAQDDRRTHWDIRELKLDVVEGDWSFTIGADTLFWGKTEAVHLVDIINQTDAVEGIDDEDRLGQPMLKVARITGIGEFSAFLLPYFRERTFPGEDGRLRFGLPVATSRPVYDTDAEEWTTSFALRYAGVIGDVDLGLSAFHGLGRDPAFLFDGKRLRPFYERITQAGFDVQYTSGATLWKAEGIYRWGQRNADFVEEDFGALTGGLEHTLFGIIETNADLGLILEYAWDSRGDDALNAFQNDLILGTRLALNDTEDTSVLVTGAIDTTDGGIALRLEAERRISERWKAQIESVGFINHDKSSPAGAFADDSFVRLKLTYFF